MLFFCKIRKEIKVKNIYEMNIIGGRIDFIDVLVIIIMYWGIKDRYGWKVY